MALGSQEEEEAMTEGPVEEALAEEEEDPNLGEEVVVDMTCLPLEEGSSPGRRERAAR